MKKIIVVPFLLSVLFFIGCADEGEKFDHELIGFSAPVTRDQHIPAIGLIERGGSLTVLVVSLSGDQCLVRYEHPSPVRSRHEQGRMFWADRADLVGEVY